MVTLRWAVIWIGLLQLAGCATSSRASITNVDVGMTQNEVISILGQPKMRETYGGTEFLFYPNDAGDNVPIAFVEGHVTSIGRAAYEIVVRSNARPNTANAR
jgi:hypothetical protein